MKKKINMYGFCYRIDGKRYSPALLETKAQALKFLGEAKDRFYEVRVVGLDGLIIYHVVDGNIVFPKVVLKQTEKIHYQQSL